MTTSLQFQFRNLFKGYSIDQDLIQSFWSEIELHYEASNRYYHNLTHLENIIDELAPLQKEIDNWELLLFSVFYHDIIYQASAQDNEEQSALLAKKRLSQIDLPEADLLVVYNQIISTKQHQKSIYTDTNYLLDADLSILGKDWEQYIVYSQNIRKEYAIYPDHLYHAGRKKALIHFLTFSEIFKTVHFKAKYENQARLNITREISLLSSSYTY